MTFRDQILTCERCGKQFIYRVEEQRLQAQMGLEPTPPKLCPKCRAEAEVASGLHAGVVKWYREDKHFGFITQSDGSEIFFHKSGVQGDPSQLSENTPVWYEITNTDRGLQAINVHIRE